MKPSRSPQGRARRALVKSGALLLSVLAGVLLYGTLYELVETFKYHHWHARYDGFGSFGTLTVPSANPVLMWEYKAYGRRVDPPAFHTNRYGFRERDLDSTGKPDGVVRVAFVGDSVTLGLRVDDDQTFVRQFEERSNVRLGAPVVQAMNFGIDGYNTVQIAELLRTKVLQFSPDVVVYTLCMNDFDFEESSGQKVRYFRKPGSFFLRRVQDLYRSLLDVDYYRYHYARTHPVIYDEIRAMRDLTGEHEISFFVAVVPLFRLGRDDRESFSDYYIADLHEKIEAFLRSEGIAHVDLLQAFRSLGVPATSLAEDPWHPNPAGHGVITTHLTPALLEAGPPLARHGGGAVP